MSHDEVPKDFVWALVEVYGENRDKYHAEGTAFCFTEQGHLFTACHVVGRKKDWDDTNSKLVARSNKIAVLRDVDYLHEYPEYDTSILKIRPESGEKFKFISLVSQFSIDVGVPLVAYGNASNLLFSTWVGSTSFKYTPPVGSIANALKEKKLTFGDMDNKECAQIRRNLPLPPYRTFAGVVSKGTLSEDVFHFHPNLPLIEAGSKMLHGYSGGPVFKKSDGIFVGMSIMFADNLTYIVPTDVLHYIAYKLAKLKDALPLPKANPL